MTSMIDVVFLLLIFFLVTTTFVRPERQLSAAIKSSQQTSAQNQSLLEPALVDVRKPGAQVVYQMGAVSTTDLKEIERMLKLHENKTDGAFVRVGDGVPFESAAQVIAACKVSGFESVAYVPLP